MPQEEQPDGQIWADGNHLDLIIDSPDGPLLRLGLPVSVFQARFVENGEILRFTYDLIDEDGSVIRGAARLVIQDLPDPRGAQA